MSTTPAGTGDGSKPPVEFTQEVRFAVVMYGGSSLAIYINGVAQELLRLVRATAPAPGGAAGPSSANLADEDLRGSERVYRRLGRMLRRAADPDEQLNETDPDPARRTPLRTRFVVDILTGTSAGGINAVFLAKALANDQDMDELKKLWITEGDIGVLINDERSYEELKLKLADDGGEPWSLLNSRRMYLKLLEALRGMEATRKAKRGEAACPKGESPLVDELDLFVTATDLPGRVLQLRLADEVVSEYRHRNVFQFRYRSQRTSDIDHSDFGPEYNAFLAFAARATSAHQAAFAPVRLDDVTPVVERYEAEGELPAADEALRVFYQDYLLRRDEGGEGPGAPSDTEALAAAFRGVWFVDGGTLDNKPFSFVIEELPLRHADTFVDRKLLYVEPSPEHLSWARAAAERPRIVGNALAGLSSLPRYETVVEDLKRLLERNRLVERLEHIMRGMEKDLVYGMRPKEVRTREEFLAMLGDRTKLLEWMRSKGTGWGSYQRLRVAEVTDDLTHLVARVAGFSVEADEFLAIRYLVRDWRAANYDPHMERGLRSEVEFLVDFDLPWAMRRIRFCIGKLNDLACLDQHARRIAGVPRGEDESGVWPGAGEEAEFRAALRRVRQGLNNAFVYLRGERRKLWSRDDANPVRPSIAALEIGSADLLELLREPTDRDRRTKATQVLGTPLRSPRADAPQMSTRGDAVASLTARVKEELARVINTGRHLCSDALRPPAGQAAAALPRWELFLRETLWYYYVYFDDFDQISYPILYSTGVGEEADVIDVFRVSPEDATAVIDESRPVDERGRPVPDGGEGRRVLKLAGTTLGNFGAFFERKFRVNDIRWGRLDGAERVIAALLPAHPELRRRMTEQAHRAIIVEEMLSDDEATAADRDLQSLVWRALDAWDDAPEQRARLLDEAARRLPEKSPLRAELEKLAGGAEPRDLYREGFVRGYDEGRQFTPEATLDSAVRVNRVLGDMALGYFPPDGGESRKRKFALLLGRRLRIFAEAALQPEGPVRRRQRLRLIACYVLSLLILVGVCLPVVVLIFRSEWLWPRLGLLVVFVITLLLAALPLLLTAGYNIAWLKLRGRLAALLPRAGATQGDGGRGGGGR
jgi:patatin-related protein